MKYPEDASAELELGENGIGLVVGPDDSRKSLAEIPQDLRGYREVIQVRLHLQLNRGTRRLGEPPELPFIPPLLDPERDDDGEYHHDRLGGHLREVPARPSTVEHRKAPTQCPAALVHATTIPRRSGVT